MRGRGLMSPRLHHHGEAESHIDAVINDQNTQPSLATRFPKFGDAVTLPALLWLKYEWLLWRSERFSHTKRTNCPEIGVCPTAVRKQRESRQQHSSLNANSICPERRPPIVDVATAAAVLDRFDLLSR